MGPMLKLCYLMVAIFVGGWGPPKDIYIKAWSQLAKQCNIYILPTTYFKVKHY